LYGVEIIDKDICSRIEKETRRERAQRTLPNNPSRDLSLIYCRETILLLGGILIVPSSVFEIENGLENVGRCGKKTDLQG